MTLAEIIHSCILEKANGQRALVTKYAPMLMTVSRRYAMSHYDADDILQDTFMQIFKSIAKFDESRGSFEGWIRKICVNTALKEIRKMKILTTADEDDRLHLSIDPDIYHKLDAEELMDLIQGLPEKYRLVFNLNCIEGYSHKEIAQLMEIEEVSSRSNLSRAKSILRKKILANKRKKSWVRTA